MKGVSKSMNGWKRAGGGSIKNIFFKSDKLGFLNPAVKIVFLEKKNVGMPIESLATMIRRKTYTSDGQENSS